MDFFFSITVPDSSVSSSWSDGGQRKVWACLKYKIEAFVTLTYLQVTEPVFSAVTMLFHHSGRLKANPSGRFRNFPSEHSTAWSLPLFVVSATFFFKWKIVAARFQWT